MKVWVENEQFFAQVSDHLFYWMVVNFDECYAEDCEDTGIYYFDSMPWYRRGQDLMLEAIGTSEGQDEWVELCDEFNEVAADIKSIGRIEPEHQFEWHEVITYDTKCFEWFLMRWGQQDTLVQQLNTLAEKYYKVDDRLPHLAPYRKTRELDEYYFVAQIVQWPESVQQQYDKMLDHFKTTYGRLPYEN